MRSGKTEDAMRTARLVRCAAARRIGRGLAVVEAEFKARRAGIGGCSEGKAAEREEKTLRSDGIGDHDAEQRTPQPFINSANFDRPPAHS